MSAIGKICAIQLIHEIYFQYIYKIFFQLRFEIFFQFRYEIFFKFRYEIFFFCIKNVIWWGQLVRFAQSNSKMHTCNQNGWLWIYSFMRISERWICKPEHIGLHPISNGNHFRENCWKMERQRVRWARTLLIMGHQCTLKNLRTPW